MNVTAEDRHQIDELYARQAQAIDRGDAVGWAETFTPGGIFESPTFGLTANGRQDLEAFAQHSYGVAKAAGKQLRHWMNAISITRTEQGFHVDAYLVILATTADGVSSIDRSLTVSDDFACVDGRLLMSSRIVHRDAESA